MTNAIDLSDLHFAGMHIDGAQDQGRGRIGTESDLSGSNAAGVDSVVGDVVFLGAEVRTALRAGPVNYIDRDCNHFEVVAADGVALQELAFARVIAHEATSFEMISLAAATANVVTFLMLTREVARADSTQMSSPAPMSTPMIAGSPRNAEIAASMSSSRSPISSTTEWGAATVREVTAAALVVALGDTNTRSANGMVDVAFIPASASGAGR